MPEAVILEAVRTPFGRRGGALREIRPDSLLAHTLKSLVQRAGIDPEKLEDVIDGTVSLAGEQGANPGRLGVLLADFPVKVPGVSLNRMCGSSQQAVHFASQAVAAGDMNYVIASGVESMTRVPMFLDISLGREGVNGFEALNPELFKHHEIIHQGESAERIADKWGISRQDVDEFAKGSHRKAYKAQQAGWNKELVPVDGVSPEAQKMSLDSATKVCAECSTSRRWPRLKPAFRPEGKGVVTAANSSQISDGASAVLVAERRGRQGRWLQTSRPLSRSCRAGIRSRHATDRRNSGHPVGAEEGGPVSQGYRLVRSERSFRDRRAELGQGVEGRPGQGQSLGRRHCTRTSARRDRRRADVEDALRASKPPTASSACR